MVPAGNKVKRLSSVNHITKTIHHQHHHRALQTFDDVLKFQKRKIKMGFQFTKFAWQPVRENNLSEETVVDNEDFKILWGGWPATTSFQYSRSFQDFQGIADCFSQEYFPQRLIKNETKIWRNEGVRSLIWRYDIWSKFDLFTITKAKWKDKYKSNELV